MEKYMKYADKATQINPFLPDKVSSSSKKSGLDVNGLTKKIGGIMFLLLRVPPLLVLSLFSYFLVTFCNPFPLFLCGSWGLFKVYHYQMHALSPNEREDLYQEVHFYFTAETWAYLVLISIALYSFRRQQQQQSNFTSSLITSSSTSTSTSTYTRSINKDTDTDTDTDTPIDIDSNIDKSSHPIAHNTLSTIFIKGLLIISGIIFVERLANIRRLGMEGKNKAVESKDKKAMYSKGMKAGDIIICNHNSPLDVLYLVYRYSSPFFLQLNDGNNHSKVEVVSSKNALLYGNNMDLLRRSKKEKQQQQQLLQEEEEEEKGKGEEETEEEGNIDKKKEKKNKKKKEKNNKDKDSDRDNYIDKFDVDWIAILNACKKEGKALVIHPEVVSTNGLGVFTFLSSLDSLPSQLVACYPYLTTTTTTTSKTRTNGATTRGSQRRNIPQVHLFTFSPLSPSSSSSSSSSISSSISSSTIPSQTIISTFSFVLRILSTIRTPILVTYLWPEYCPQIEKDLFTMPTHGRNHQKDHKVKVKESKWKYQLRELFSQMLGIPKLDGIDYTTFETFIHENPKLSSDLVTKEKKEAKGKKEL